MHCHSAYVCNYIYTVESFTAVTLGYLIDTSYLSEYNVEMSIRVYQARPSSRHLPVAKLKRGCSEAAKQNCMAREGPKDVDKVHEK